MPDLSDTHRLVWETMHDFGAPMSDWSLIHAVQARCAGRRKLSPSGIRSRRAELVRAGLVRRTSLTETTPSGRRASLWRAV